MIGEDLMRPPIARLDEAADLRIDLLRRLLGDVLLARHRVAEEDLFLVLAIGDGAELSEKPQRVTIMRASRVACSMSEAAPDVTLSLPKIISSATRPPIMMARREVICSKLIDSLSRSGSCMTMPSARPRGMIVALCTGSVAVTLRATDRVAGLVIGGEPLLLLGHDQRTPLGAHHDLVLGVLELGHA